MPNYDELMGYLNQLCREKADGTLFISTDKNHSVRFELHNGYITFCNYRSKRDHDAIKLIKAVKSCKYKFIPGSSEPKDKDTARRSDLYTALFEKTLPLPKEMKSVSTADSISPTASPPLETGTIGKAVETIAKELANFIGPVAKMICDEYINSIGQARSTHELIAMVESVATEIGDSAQEKQFIKAALGSIRSAL